MQKQMLQKTGNRRSLSSLTVSQYSSVTHALVQPCYAVDTSDGGSFFEG